jgi:uncharacterized protein (TIGR02271 family)
MNPKWKEEKMTTKTQTSVVGVFHDQAQAQRAVNELKRAGFTDDQIGIIGRDSSGKTTHTSGDGTDSYAAEGAATGLATGAGIGALWGLGVISNVLPAIGPAIVGGTIAAILSSAAVGAAAATLAGTLVGMGISKDEAEYYESEFKSGRLLVTVSAAGREAEARKILQSNGGYDSANRSTSTSSASHLQGSSTHSASALNTVSGDACSTTSRATSAQTAHNAPVARGNTVQAVEEKLDVHKTRSQGEVNVRKEVHTEHKSIEVPVTREEVVIERRPASGTAPAAGAAGHQEIRIPVMEEHVSVEKTPVVKEEVSVSKQKVQGTQHVSETLRKEEIKVDTKGDVNVRDKR